MRLLKAVKAHKYGTRQLTAGEEYEAPDRQALALVASKKARFADRPTRVVAPAPAVHPESEPKIAESHAVGAMTSAQLEPPSLDSLRLEATQLGINIDGRWGAPRLQQEIEKAKG